MADCGIFLGKNPRGVTMNYVSLLKNTFYLPHTLVSTWLIYYPCIAVEQHLALILKQIYPFNSNNIEIEKAVQTLSCESVQVSPGKRLPIKAQ